MSDSSFNCLFDIQKSNNSQQMVFGWASIAARADGKQIEDYQNDIIDIEDLEKAAYDFVLKYRTGGEMHERSGVATLVESIVFTKEKTQRMGIPDATMPEGWWIGFKVTDKNVWKKIQNGELPMFSIEGRARREEI